MLNQLHWLDFIVLAIGFLIVIGIGVFSARRSNSAEAYFLAGRSLPGWLVGFSVMATIVSSMTFLANPAFAYEHDWRHMPAIFTYVLAMAVALALFIPFYRRLRLNSIYEYLERRFGGWARFYAAGCYILLKVAKMGLVLYMASIALQTIIGTHVPFELVILVFGVVVAVYTIAGGLEAVIWTDLLQGIALIGGGLVCIPIIASLLGGGYSPTQLQDGFGQIFQVAWAEGKMSVGDTDLTLVKITLWATVISKFVNYCQLLGTDQTTGQRYAAASSDREARTAVIFGCLLTIPVWAYFFFIGTSLFVLYQIHPDPTVDAMKPDQVFPYFIATQVPPGLAGFVIMGLLAAAMSTLDSIINAAAATATTDFYQRLWVKDRDPRHYATVGRLFSVLFSVIMIGSALVIHGSRQKTSIEDFQLILLSIFGGGLLGLFMLGFLTRRVDSRSALVATIITVLGIVCWLFLSSATGAALFPLVAPYVPSTFWVGVFANVILFVIGYFTSCLLGSRTEKERLQGLTIWEPRIEGNEN